MCVGVSECARACAVLQVKRNYSSFPRRPSPPPPFPNTSSALGTILAPEGANKRTRSALAGCSICRSRRGAARRGECRMERATKQTRQLVHSRFQPTLAFQPAPLIGGNLSRGTAAGWAAAPFSERRVRRERRERRESPRWFGQPFHARRNTTAMWGVVVAVLLARTTVSLTSRVDILGSPRNLTRAAVCMCTRGVQHVHVFNPQAKNLRAFPQASARWCRSCRCTCGPPG